MNNGPTSEALGYNNQTEMDTNEIFIYIIKGGCAAWCVVRGAWCPCKWSSLGISTFCVDFYVKYG